MDENVAEAVERMDHGFTLNGISLAHCAHWQTIRARLVELESENERLRESTHHANGVADLAMKHRDDAEGRAEKADALLRECYEHGYDMKIHDRITAHLSENGHG